MSHLAHHTDDAALAPIPHSFEIAIADENLSFSSYILPEPRSTGRQIAQLSGRGNPDELIVLEWQANGNLLELQLDQETHLPHGAAAQFLVIRSDRTYRFEIEGKRQEWPLATIKGLTLKRLNRVDPEEVLLVQIASDGAERTVGDEEDVSLSGQGLEHFVFRPARQEVQISVNERPVTIRRGPQTGLSIKQAAIEQGVNIQLDFILSEEKRDGTTKIIGDNDSVRVHGNERFIAVANDDNS